MVQNDDVLVWAVPRVLFFFLQTVDTGGIAFLTFQTAAISTIVILAFEILRHQRTRENVVTFGSLASFVILCLVYGAWRDLTFRSSTEYGKAILLGVRPTVLRMDRLKRAVDQSKRWSIGGCRPYLYLKRAYFGRIGTTLQNPHWILQINKI